MIDVSNASPSSLPLHDQGVQTSTTGSSNPAETTSTFVNGTDAVTASRFASEDVPVHSESALDSADLPQRTSIDASDAQVVIAPGSAVEGAPDTAASQWSGPSDAPHAYATQQAGFAGMSGTDASTYSAPVGFSDVSAVPQPVQSGSSVSGAAAPQRARGVAQMAGGAVLAAAGVPMLVLPGPGVVAIVGGAAMVSKGHRTMTGREATAVEEKLDTASEKLVEVTKEQTDKAMKKAVMDGPDVAERVLQAAPMIAGKAAVAVTKGAGYAVRGIAAVAKGASAVGKGAAAAGKGVAAVSKGAAAIGKGSAAVGRDAAAKGEASAKATSKHRIKKLGLKAGSSHRWTY